MKIVLSGGGTGGHITPILAVCHELKKLDPSCSTVYIGERKTKFSSFMADSTVIDEKHAIFSGKLRRYHGESWPKRIFDIKTNLKNLRDVLYVLIGICQSFWLLGKIKPDLVFLKGGYVGVPVGLAAALRRIPIATHDSDALPGLANRLVSRWVSLHATALPPEAYDYPSGKTQQVGVLVEHNYQPVGKATQEAFKQQLKLHPDEKLLLITGGSSGAQGINKAFISIMPELLIKLPRLHVIHQVGQGRANAYGEYTSERLQVVELMSPMYIYTGAADLIVTRAGANALAEFGTQGKACIVIPSPHLSGGHQLKNAQFLKEQGTAVVLAEKELHDLQHGLLATILELLGDDETRRQLGEKLQKSTLTNAANKLANLLLEQAKLHRP